MIGPFPDPWIPVPMQYEEGEQDEEKMMLRNPETGEIRPAKEVLQEPQE